MHPALSVVFFTTATGAGYGLLALLGILSAGGALPESRWFGALGLGLALLLITAGLLSSTAHLTHPERAWRAFSQWRSSWLSREGVMSLATYVPAAVLALGWLWFGRTDGAFAAAGVASAAFACATVLTTAMIYASLKPVAQWHSRYTVPGYLIYSMMSGAVILDLLLQAFGVAPAWFAALVLLLLALGWGWKTATWRHNDRSGIPVTLGSATGLAGGEVRSVEWPHTEENFVLKETGFRIARKHSARLRTIVHVLAFAAPLALTAGVAIFGGIPGLAAAVLAVLSLAPGMLVERWLFFAEAKHTASLYYGR